MPGSAPIVPETGLQALFAPRSIAVVGASDVPGSWGAAVTEAVLADAAGRPVHLVNRRGRTLFGHGSAATLADLGERPELVLLVVPAAGFLDVVEQALAAGGRALVAFTSGLGETGADGLAIERAAADRVRAAGGVLLGPNCMGLLDRSSGLDAAPWVDLPPGDIALVSQSGNLAFDLAGRARDAGLGFSRFVSLGNQADLDAARLIADCARHEATRTIALYCEDFRDGRAFVAAAAAARAAGRHVLVLAPGRTAAGARAARSHTGSLASPSAVVDAACRAAGALRVATPRELMETALALRAPARPRGRRVGIVTTGGGNGVIAADAVGAAGLEVPELGPAARDRIRGVVSRPGSDRNPVDLVGDVLVDAAVLPAVVAELARCGEVDAVLLTGSPFAMWDGLDDGLAAEEERAVPAFVEAVAASATPLLVSTDRLGPPAVRAALAAGIPVYRDVESAAACLARLREAERAPSPPPALPPPAARLGAAAAYEQARRLLAAAGVPTVEARPAGTLDAALAAAEAIGYPVVLKAVALLHKSDAGGVALALGTPEALRAAWRVMEGRLGPGPRMLERMAPAAAGVELIIGCRRDARFGPVALVGMGGVYAELLSDVRLALAPVTEATVRELIAGLAGVGLLRGARGRPPLDEGAAARALVALAGVAAAHPEIRELEVNPLLVLPEGALALDARVIVDEEGSDELER